MKRMLVDATHPEETRVAVVSGNRLEELDFEIASRKQLKGNIYLAKVTRVEPSLQAAFVEYGGNRHGFLAFSEVHPDYYRIPVADREALMAEERRQEEEAEARAERAEQRGGRRSLAEEIQPEEFSERISPMPTPIDADAIDAETIGSDDENGGNGDGYESNAGSDDDGARDARENGAYAEAAGETYAEQGTERGSDEAAGGESGAFAESALAEAGETAEAGAAYGTDATAKAPQTTESERFDVVGGDEVEEVQRRRTRPLRSYKIQEVIKRRQIMLVQVTKEERGNKGAALTTYLSLPGRYCVLMPNTGRGGGISRKITNPLDRKRLKEILSELDIPDGMAVILRTAGLERSKQEIKRDLEYLLRLWDDIREQTLQSSAPCLIYEEANLIKRAIRDLYGNDIDEIWVEGNAGYHTAKEFMRMLMPSHVKRVQPYKEEAIPLFHRYQVETQIDAIHSPIVHLRSGGYIVINPTEALVAIDVNSGKSTRERNIEETAFKTNLEAAEEVARQLRLRDLAGLIVIDFIDMEEPRNNATVERRLKEAMKTDRARIQLGRISAFGLLELSRQRLRPSLLETNFERCPHCSGAGVIRSVESASLHVLRAIEEEGIRKRSAEITVYVPTSIALYILNQKRTDLARIEYKYGFRVLLLADDTLIAPDLRLERVKAKQPGDEGGPLVSAERIFAETDRTLAAAAAAPQPVEAEEADEDEEESAEVETEAEAAASEEDRADAEGAEAGAE
ncbi:Rne/Rng family ribonuclease, partial [Devosia sp.]|uniref:Rne/Rng family ribonuclease n=1 Tax=Devosia sp. TaxID=1871048 RepID=UPI002EDDA2AB